MIHYDIMLYIHMYIYINTYMYIYIHTYIHADITGVRGCIPLDTTIRLEARAVAMSPGRSDISEAKCLRTSWNWYKKHTQIIHGAGIFTYIETPFLWPSFVGKYTSTMDHLGLKKSDFTMGCRSKDNETNKIMRNVWPRLAFDITKT